MLEIVRHLGDVQSIADVCGEIRVLSGADDFGGANLAVAAMRAPTIPHYHEIATEFYFVSKGSGRLIVGANTHEIKRGTLVIIPPNNAHYAIPREATEVLAFSVPAWSEEDQIVLEESDTIAGYSLSKERFELVEEAIWLVTPHEGEVPARAGRARILQADWDSMSIPELRELLRIS